jgi:hypothetical protein
MIFRHFLIQILNLDGYMRDFVPQKLMKPKRMMKNLNIVIPNTSVSLE